MIGQGCGTADGQDRSSLLDEFQYLGDGLFRGDRAEHVTVFRRNTLRVDARHFPPESFPLVLLFSARPGKGAADENEDVEFLPQAAGVELLGEDEPVREPILFQEPAHPAGGHRAAVGVP